jgi:carboxyl-terminal processing protease
LILLSGAFSGGVAVGVMLPSSLVSLLPLNLKSIDSQAQTTPVPQASPEELQTLFKPFWTTWKIVHDEFVDQPVNELKMMQGAIRGMLQSLGDQHTSYMDPEQFKQANAPLQGGYEGIGAWVDTTGEFLTITNPMPDSPAEKAGLKSGDMIVAVDGEDMTGLDGSLVLRRVLGPAGTEVKLTILREKEKPFEVLIKRAKIVMPSIVSKMLDNNIAYVQITTFGETTGNDLVNALKQLLANKPKGLILDLRNNGGGYLSTSIQVVSQFINGGKPALYERFGDGKEKVYNTFNGGLATDIPLVVLVNEGTASASEITAGAIQDYQRGKLVGVTTYGKGSVQDWIPLADDQGAVRVTIARWLTPNKRLIHQIGLKPDVEVAITEDDIKNKKDPQLEKAIELLK